MPAICASCGEANPDRARFCLSCGQALTDQRARPAETRRRVTVVFSDVTGSTGIGERLDPETLRRVMGRYFDLMRGAIERHGGTVEKFIGDAVMAVFGIPRLHEDDALRAVRAAVDAREALARLNEELERDQGFRVTVRTGINTGDVVAGATADSGAGGTLVTGDAVNVAARLEQAAAPGEILIGAETERLVRHAAHLEPVPALTVKGKNQPLAAYRLLAVERDVAVQHRRLDAPLVGRERELRLLTDAFGRAQADRACHLVTVLGPAGVGKSRLVLELERVAGPGATVLRGRCLSYGEGITYWPLSEALRSVAGLDEAPAADERRARMARLLEGQPQAEAIAGQVAALIGPGGGLSSSTEAFWAVRRLLEAMARRAPLIVVFEDIHWATPTFLDLIEHVAEWTRDVPILLVCLARPELRDQRAGWGAGNPNASSFLLEPLERADADHLLDHLLGTDGEARSGSRVRIIEVAEGNPLFVEELVAMLAERPVSDASEALSMPPTIETLIAARIDQLPAGERALLERASVIGRQFGIAEVTQLTAEEERAGVRTGLRGLVRKELIRPDPEAMLSTADEEPYRFRHQLIRDGAYAGLPKQARAEVHEAYADWLERSADQLPQLDELAGHHLAEAHRYRTELGGEAEQAHALAARAVARLGAAGLRAVEQRRDIAAGSSLLRRALDLMPAGDAARPPLLSVLGEALMSTGDLPGASAALEEAARTGDLRARAMAADVQVLLDTAERSPSRMRPLVESVLREAEESGDDMALAWVLLALGRIAYFEGALTASAACFDRSLRHAETANSLALQARVVPLRFITRMDLSPRSEVEQYEAELEEFARANDLPHMRALALKGVVYAWQRRFDEARRMLAEQRAAHRERGERLWDAAASQSRGRVEELAGDQVRRERELREGYEILEAMGERGFLSTIAANLADSLAQLGRLDEAEEFAVIGERAGSPDDIVTATVVRVARSRIAARRGDLETAERLAREALAIADRTEYYAHRSEARFALAEALAGRGTEEEAAQLIGQVLELARRKEDEATAARAESLLKAAGSTAPGGPSAQKKRVRRRRTAGRRRT